MALNNLQYESIKRVYEERRLAHAYRQKERRQEVYDRIPGFKELDDQVIATSMKQGRLLIMAKGDSADRDAALKQLRLDLLDLKMQKKKLLTEAGYPYDYLDLEYTCSQCRDTGYIDSEKCSCFRQMEVEFLYDASRIRDLLAVNNFSNLSKHYYYGDDLENFEHALDTSHKFVNNFNSDYRNLLFYGTVGTGKSFLSGCIARELLSQSYSVIYFSSNSLFETLSRYSFDIKSKDSLYNFYKDLYNCDLVIIDDLGTEVTNSFVTSQLFGLLNERHLRQKSTIISTNLSLEELRDRYSDRVFSRITSNYSICKLTGQDIRIQRKLSGKLFPKK